MKVVERSVDVSAAALGQGVRTAVTVFVPERRPAPVDVLVAYPGAGYGRRYFDIEASPGYSQAAFHTAQGFVFVACDHPGVGDSSEVDPLALSYEGVAAANDATARRVLRDLREGSIDAGTPPMEIGRVIGMGQSMGGCFLTVQQANHRTFERIALLGWSGRWTNFPAADGTRLVFDGPDRGAQLGAALAAMTDHGLPTPEQMAYCFHWEDEDPSLRDPDVDSYRPFTDVVRGDERTPWGTSRIPACSATMARQGTVAAEAATIDVPILLAFGERDVTPDPWCEPMAYRNSTDVSLLVVERMAHMHNFAATREVLWRRISAFARA